MIFVVTGEASDEQLIAAVRGAVERELERQGQRGALSNEGVWLVLGKGATRTRAQVHGTLEQWQNLPDDLQERRARELATLLLAKPADAPAVPSPRPRADRPGWASVVAPLLIASATVLALLLAYRVLAPGGRSPWPRLGGMVQGAAPISSAGHAPAELSQSATAARVSACDNVRARVARGASIGPADVEGWQVELVLFRRGPAVDLSHAPALRSFLRPQPDSAANSWIWPNAKSLLLAQRFDALVEVAALPPLGAAQLSGARFVFTGPYVTPYFSEDLRADYLQLADALADALAATEGALYARCENQETHAIGSWFLGASPGGAMGSLVYFMAGFTDLPALKPELLGTGDEGVRHNQAFDAIDKAVSGVDRARAATLVGRELGIISTRPNKPSRLTFPFRDANRAQRSSLDVARALGLAASR